MIWLGRRIAEGQIAFMLLSRLPAGKLGPDIPTLAEARWAFPFVGVAIAAIIAGLYSALSLAGLAPPLSALLALSAGLFATGAMHEDGLADCADGFGGGLDRQRKLAIMKDSQIGSYGVLALILVMAARAISLSSFIPSLTFFGLILSFAVISRLVMVFYLSLLPAARENGLGQDAGRLDMKPVLIAVLISSPALIYGAIMAPLALAILILVSLMFARLAKKQIGGQTGDVCGASQLLSETAAWICLTAIPLTAL